MFTRKRLPFFLVMFMVIYFLVGCSPIYEPVEVDNQPEAAAPSEEVNEPKGADPSEEVGEPSVEVEVQPEVNNNGAIIAPENLTRLAPLTLVLPEYPERILWSKPGAAGAFPDAPLLLLSGARLHPLALDRRADQAVMNLSDSIPLPLNGNQIVAFAPDASSLLVQEPGRLALYSPDGRLQREIAELDRTGSASFSPDSRALAITSQEEFAAYVYGTDGSITKLTGFETAAPVYSVLLGPQGKTLAWISRATLQFDDVTMVKEVPGTRLHFSDFIGPVVFSPDGGRLALYVAGSLYLYRAPEGELLAEIPLDGPVISLDFSPSGEILAGSYGNGFQTWDGWTLEPLVTLPSDGSETIMVSFSPDGRMLVTTHNNNELRVWMVE